MWADWTEYQQAYPASAALIDADQYAELARQAELLINARTHYMARSALTEASFMMNTALLRYGALRE